MSFYAIGYRYNCEVTSSETVNCKQKWAEPEILVKSKISSLSVHLIYGVIDRWFTSASNLKQFLTLSASFLTSTDKKFHQSEHWK